MAGARRAGLVHNGLLAGHGPCAMGRELRDLPLEAPGLVRRHSCNSQLGGQPGDHPVVPVPCQGHRHVHDFSLLRLHHGGGASVRASVGAGDQRTVVPGSGAHVGGESPRPSKLAPWVRGEEYTR